MGLSVHDALDERKQVEGAAGKAVDARDRHYVAGVEDFEKFEPAGARVTFSR